MSKLSKVKNIKINSHFVDCFMAYIKEKSFENNTTNTYSENRQIIGKEIVKRHKK